MSARMATAVLSSGSPASRIWMAAALRRSRVSYAGIGSGGSWPAGRAVWGASAPWWRLAILTLRWLTILRLTVLTLRLAILALGCAVLTLLRTRLDDLAEGTSGCLLLEGPAGIGKTRLLEELR